ncbi:MAG: hypothetical protein RQ833_05600 [Sphingomonadaceae bacterium]|nr:hypothetical protein [Sphingomonadaceae bacterium]
MLTGDAKLQRLFARDASAGGEVAEQSAREVPQGLAGQLYLERRQRVAFFGGGLFWEPAWDLLLYLYDAIENGVAAVERERAARACATVSDASAERWITMLCTQGFAPERRDSSGRQELCLTAAGIGAMEAYLIDLAAAKQQG